MPVCRRREPPPDGGRGAPERPARAWLPGPHRREEHLQVIPGPLQDCTFELQVPALVHDLARPHGDRMKSYRYRDRIAVDQLELIDVPTPTPGPHELLLRIRAVSLNYRDLAIARDGYGGFAAPLVPLSDAAGEVVARGAGVTRFGLGELVIPTYVPDWLDGPARPELVKRRLGGPTDGVLGEYLVVHEQAAVRAPAHLEPAEAATLPIAALTAWQAVVQGAAIQPGETVAVHGTGGVALFVVQLARAAGAIPIVITRDPERAARVAALGALALDTRADAAWEHRVLALTDQRGADVFVDVVGGDELPRAVTATRLGGTIALVGFAASTTTTLALPAIINRSLTLRAVSVGNRTAFTGLVRALEAARIRPVIDRVFPFDQARDALHYLETGRPFGKVVIEVAP
jgi:NADPH:quinone reductase-like Zn-dependent oxidoreductase